jgi:hypothetical protein
MMDSIGVRPKSTYVQSGGIRGIPANKGGTPNEGYSKYKNPNVEIYAERWEQGLDIWTGEPLTGAGLMDWQKQRKKRRNLLE